MRFSKDSIRRFVLWKKKFQNYSIHFDSEGFVYDSRILTIFSLLSIRKSKKRKKLNVQKNIFGVFYTIVIVGLLEIVTSRFFFFFCKMSWLQWNSMITLTISFFKMNCVLRWKLLDNICILANLKTWSQWLY
jgi:hypothetical protein